MKAFLYVIAAIAKTNGEAILTRDQHFKSIKGIVSSNGS